MVGFEGDDALDSLVVGCGGSATSGVDVAATSAGDGRFLAGAVALPLPTNVDFPYSLTHCLREWQEIWSNCVNNKLFAIYQTVGSVVHNKGLSRHESVIINRLRIGHTRLTHSHLLSGDDQPTCSSCGHPLTVHHILLDCVDLQDVRRKHFSVTCLRDLFQTVDNRTVIDFIKEIRFYSLL